MTDLSQLGKTVAKFAPLLGAIIPVPGAAAIGTAIAAAFGESTPNSEGLIPNIASSPDAEIKLKQIEVDYQLQIQKILADQAIAQINADSNAIDKEAQDRASAREMSIKEPLWGIDNIIKGWLAFSSVLIVVLCLIGIMKGDFTAEEVTLVNGILNLVAGTYLAMAGFYFGSSFSSQKKDLLKK